MALTIISIDVNGLRGLTRRARFLDWLHSLLCIPDIVCLQEALCMSSEECSSWPWFSSSGLSFVVSPGSINSCECFVLYCPVLSVVSSSWDSSDRFLLCNYLLSWCPVKGCFCLRSELWSWAGYFFSDVASRVVPSVPIVLIGDFNTVFDRFIDRTGSVIGDVSSEISINLGRLFSTLYWHLEVSPSV